ncbi:MAG: putative transport system permease protein [Thermodesulfobacteriota bacterium]|jgi:putative ABC transport system permease protein|nr:putative transport system permease protein [Thermodesulfobacteriota bacterium]
MLLKLLIRNAFRHKLRAGLTVCGICVAILAFGLLRTVISAWYAGVEASSSTRLVTRNAISLIFPLPLSYKDKIRGAEGVKIVSLGNWFGGIYIEEKNFFANFAVDSKTYLDLYPEFVIPPDQKLSFLKERKGCVVGRKLAKRFGWKIGDTIVLRGTIFPGNWEFILKAIYKGRDKTIDESQFFFHWDYLNETMKKVQPRRADQVGFYMIGTSSPDIAASTSKSVDALFKNSFAETLTETEKAFQMSFIALSQTILTVIQLVSLVVVIIILAVVANTMAMSVRERMSEYAVFKTIGFGGFYISVLILGESLLITAIGCALGIIATFPAADAFASAVGDYFPIFNISSQTIYLDMLAALIVGLVAAVFPIWRAVSVPIASGLGRVG